MLPKTHTQEKKLEDYKNLIKPQLYNQIKNLSVDLRGLKIAHINATSQGGGVAELLKSLVPLMNNMGLDAGWYTLPPGKMFFKITKNIHNILQGERKKLSKTKKAIYFRQNKKAAKLMKDIDADIYVIHDPQPLPLIRYHPNLHPSILRMHIDLSDPEPSTWQMLFPYVLSYDKTIFSMKEFINGHIPKNKACICPPAIDPLSPKNIPLDQETAKEIVKNLGINIKNPLISQIARFDVWKDPIGVIRAYKIAKKKIPKLQLALIGLFLAQDDPEAIKVFKKVKKESAKDPDIYLFSDIREINIENDTLVNAFQVASNVVLQKSIKEGFGLTVTEAMWKGKPVIGGNVGGIKLQIQDGENGFLVNSPEQASKKIIKLINNPELAEKMGKRAKETVRENFLTPRLLRDYLKLFTELI